MSDPEPSAPSAPPPPPAALSPESPPPASPPPVPAAGATPAPVAAPAAAAPPAPAIAPDRPLRARDLRAAARSPAEIADALAREAKVRKKRAARAAQAAQEATPPAPHAPQAPAPPPAPPAPAPAPLPPPMPRPTATPPTSSPRLAHAPPPPVVVVPIPPRAPAPAPRPQARIVRARPPYLVIAALVLQAAALAYLAWATSRIERALDRPIADAQAPRSVLEAPQAQATSPHPPSIASVGEGQVVYALDGKLVLMKRDRESQELVIERVYSLEHDEARNVGDDARRAYSGFYLVDLEHERRKAVEIEDGFFKDAIAKARDQKDGLAYCLAVARRLAAAGGADRLRKRLDDRDAFGRHAAAIALGENGYLIAIPELIQIVEGTGDSDLRKHVVGLLRDLTGIAFETDEGGPAVARRADDWWKKNAPDDPFARRVAPPR